MSLLPTGGPGLAGRSEAPESDPRTASFKDDRPEIQALFELALEGKIPRRRELKPWEPQRLNERHLAMVMMRATGVQQRTVAQAFDVTDSNASIILNHPDAEYLLSRLAAMKATHESSIEARLRRLSEPAIEALEAVFNPTAEPEEARAAMKRAPMAFKVLDYNGYRQQKPQEHRHQHEHAHRLEASPKQLGELALALRESRQIPIEEGRVEPSAGEVRALLPPAGGLPGGEPPASPPSELPPQGGSGAPSISDSQEVPPRKKEA